MKPLVVVEWRDAMDHAEKWVGEEDAEQFGEVDCTIVSVGFLIRKTGKYITLGADWDATDLDYGRVTKIPTHQVDDVTEIPLPPKAVPSE